MRGEAEAHMDQDFAFSVLSPVESKTQDNCKPHKVYFNFNILLISQQRSCHKNMRERPKFDTRMYLTKPGMMVNTCNYNYKVGDGQISELAG